MEEMGGWEREDLLSSAVTEGSSDEVLNLGNSSRHGEKGYLLMIIHSVIIKCLPCARYYSTC